MTAGLQAAGWVAAWGVGTALIFGAARTPARPATTVAPASPDAVCAKCHHAIYESYEHALWPRRLRVGAQSCPGI